MVAVVRSILLVVGLLAYSAVALGLAQHAAVVAITKDSPAITPEPEPEPDPGAKRKRADEKVDPFRDIYDDVDELLVGARSRLVVAPANATRPAK